MDWGIGAAAIPASRLTLRPPSYTGDRKWGKHRPSA
jgi:hypothetical protein